MHYWPIKEIYVSLPLQNVQWSQFVACSQIKNVGIRVYIIYGLCRFVSMTGTQITT